jgi:hypothetical protein
MEFPRGLKQFKEFDNGGMLGLTGNNTNHCNEQRRAIGVRLEIIRLYWMFLLLLFLSSWSSGPMCSSMSTSNNNRQIEGTVS